jgi:hypothetical protein
MPIAQKLPIAARSTLVLSWCMLAAAGCSRGRPAATTTEVAPTGTALWLEDPCASDSIDEFGWTLYNLRDITVRVPRDFERIAKWDPDLLSFRRGSATLSLSLSRDSWYGLQNSIRAKPRLRTCYGEIAGYVANVATYAVDGYYTYIVYWDHRWEVNSVGKWLLGIVRARNPGDANRLRQALLTVRLPLESGSPLPTPQSSLLNLHSPDPPSPIHNPQSRRIEDCVIGDVGSGKRRIEEWGVWIGDWGTGGDWNR